MRLGTKISSSTVKHAIWLMLLAVHLKTSSSLSCVNTLWCDCVCMWSWLLHVSGKIMRDYLQLHSCRTSIFIIWTENILNVGARKVWAWSALDVCRTYCYCYLMQVAFWMNDCLFPLPSGCPVGFGSWDSENGLASHTIPNAVELLLHVCPWAESWFSPRPLLWGLGLSKVCSTTWPGLAVRDRAWHSRLSYELLYIRLLANV